MLNSLKGKEFACTAPTTDSVLVPVAKCQDEDGIALRLVVCYVKLRMRFKYLIIRGLQTGARHD